MPLCAHVCPCVPLCVYIHTRIYYVYIYDMHIIYIVFMAGMYTVSMTNTSKVCLPYDLCLPHDLILCSEFRSHGDSDG